MKKYIICFFFAVFLTLFGSTILLAQKISNVRVEQDFELRYYKITFDLSGEEDHPYSIQVIPHRDGRELSKLSFMLGTSTTESIFPGKDHRVFWNPILEGFEPEGWQFRISVKHAPKSMVSVQGGSFRMGSNDGRSHEKPIHEVIVSSFWIGKYQVTQKEWKEVMGNNPSNWQDDNLPVENVSWYDAVEYCNRRSIQEGLTPCYSGKGSGITCDWNANGYRLPTEAEWEYAARGGHKSKGFVYSGSDDINEVAWHEGNSDRRTHNVGDKNSNELGIHDMSGNVWEWCWDWYAGSYYKKSPSINPKGPNSGSYRVLRGGSWSNLDLCRVSNRSNSKPISNSRNHGFRVAGVFY